MAPATPTRTTCTHFDTSVRWYVIGIEFGGGSTATKTAPARSDPHTLELPVNVREFCDQKRLAPDVEKTLALAEQHFTVVGGPEFQVIDDPEYGQHYLCIDIQVIGEAEDVFLQGEAFLESFVAFVGRENQEFISLVYHST